MDGFIIAPADIAEAGRAHETPLNLDDDIDRLATAIALEAGQPYHIVVRRLQGLGESMSMSALRDVARQPFEPHELQFSVVKQRIRKLMNQGTPRWTHCTGGTTSIEISPNGGYSRCPKHGAKQAYLGNLRDEGPLHTLDPHKDEMGCTIRCPQLMCFSGNVLRATSRAELDADIARVGLRGVYGEPDRGGQSDVFVRWKITDVCNFTCTYCTDWRSVNKKGIELTDDEVLGGLDKIMGQFNVISLRLTGGEPSARRCYVELMRRIHSNLSRFSDVEIRTNFSYQAKHREVLSWDWQGKLHLHIGCHVRDKNFMPWRTVEVLRDAPDADYKLKFVATPSNREHVEYFGQYFRDNGIPASRIRVIEEVTGKETDPAAAPVPAEMVPFARKYLEELARREADVAA
jgi:sulfatase maturation enzyme AslB (radical SAM superfamily)